MECVESGAAAADASGLVIWLHGLGADGHDFAPVVELLGRPDLRFVLPHAPTGTVTINRGMVMRRWYDIVDADPEARFCEVAADIEASRALINELIDSELATAALIPRRCVIAGFSQGGAMAYDVGLRRAEPLGGILALSCYLPLATAAATERATRSTETPIFAAHGQYDPIVPFHHGQAAARQVEAWGHQVTWESYPMQHEVSLPEIEALSAWLNAMVPAD